MIMFVKTINLNMIRLSWNTIIFGTIAYQSAPCSISTPNYIHMNLSSNFTSLKKRKTTNHFNLVLFIFMACGIFVFGGCGNSGDSGTAKKAVYVKPSIDSRGRFRKGHVRMPVSTKKNAIKSQSRSRYYYQTRGKYRRKKS